jgi:hypothetical protein
MPFWPLSTGESPFKSKDLRTQARSLMHAAVLSLLRDFRWLAKT